MARGDEEFAEFVRASSARLTHAAFLLTGDRHQAEDAAQTAFTRTYAAWSRVRHKDAYGYARTVLVNHVIDGWRRPIREYATEALPEQQDRLDVDKAVTQRAWLTAVLKTLTARERAVVVLRHFFDLPEADVARELGVSVGTVKSTNSRALAKLRIEAADPEDTLIGGCGR
ncbi:SigE family RNA polymerase sigma factor [Amycolatopsis vancoresmycina]|uniref:RNA polymerase ECF sigma factor n=1 Tax=Amycolatopsis vancoresmycina DSM 44592 TaxID=1292037 RepID=R1FXT3_9PSEU|nr:SigE family RNA polymerase sigma factor [Amycolatopsis vancoresmycina]EOD64127.1 RNA polymerase ECF sigma factor [Amycolatopsis vancoresmycina DSM 44592]